MVDHLDQTEEDRITGADVVDGALKLKRHGGTVTTFSPFVHVQTEFAFDTPDILTGVVVYEPSVGDLVLDAWIELITPWESEESSYGDLGTFVETVYGLWGEEAPLEFSSDLVDGDADGAQQSYGGEGILFGSYVSNSRTLQHAYQDGDNGWFLRVAPFKMTIAHPLKFVVNGNGTSTGTDPVATAGSAIIHFLIVPA